jgi:peptide/nickel transport system permease protein
VILFLLSVYVLVGIPQSTSLRWYNTNGWSGNPVSAPPTWVNYLGVDAPATVNLTLSSWSQSSPAKLNVYTATAEFTWLHSVEPQQVIVLPVFSGTVLEAMINWTKPDGNSVAVILNAPASGVRVDLDSPDVKQYLTQYIQSQTGKFVGSVTLPQELAALFAKDGPALLNNSVDKGEYHVTVQMVSSSTATISPSSALTLLGDSFGSMGSDYYGRPISLGILAGVPWALEVGGLSSVVSVVVGVVFGGISGYVGGRKDQVMQWAALVVLALPALPFLIALSYSVTLTLVSESLLIAALSWPFFAIIARSASLSIKSQTYVEADQAMGVSQVRTFASHFLPRLTPFTVAYTALGVPAGIIFGQTLAFLGIQPPEVITWGSLLDDAFTYHAGLYGWWWWILFPGVMIIVASVPFVLVGFALDKIVAPRVNAK